MQITSYILIRTVDNLWDRRAVIKLLTSREMAANTRARVSFWGGAIKYDRRKTIIKLLYKKQLTRPKTKIVLINKKITTANDGLGSTL